MKLDRPIPNGVRLIALGHYLFSAWYGFVAALLLFFALTGAVSGSGGGGFLHLPPAFFALAGAIFGVFGVAFLLVGRGLWKGRPWARGVAIALSALSFFGTLGTSQWINMLIHGAIVVYLAFNAQVRRAFS
jgi:hypothetical protein